MILDAFEADTVADINETLEINGYAHLADHDRIASAAADKRAKVAEILANGLDIGTLGRFLIPVTLDKNADYGWVFISQAKRRRGEMFLVNREV